MAFAVTCAARLGRVQEAARQLANIDREQLDEESLVELTDTAVWVHGALGRPRAAEPWLRRALHCRSARLRRDARLTAAGAAWDRGDLHEVDRLLDRDRPAESGRAHWRWRHLSGLRALTEGDAVSARRQFARALAGSRRGLAPFDAASLWNDLALSRVALGDLAGAERALEHCVRLHQSADGDRGITLALSNLAEVRLRRGRPAGVREVLERSARSNRAGGNRRAAVYDRELLVRYQLLCEGPEAALETSRRALEEMECEDFGGRPEALAWLAARALGWLGRPQAAAAELQRSRERPVAVFESEELPALWALAGEHERATRVVEGAAAEIWRSVLRGERISTHAWEGADALGEFRSARLCVDLEMVSPSLVPSARLRRAERVLRVSGASWLADRLERASGRAWKAVESYLAGSSSRSVEELFEKAGYLDVQLSFEGRGVANETVGGPGGAEELRAPVAGGEWVLRANRIDAPLRAFLALVVRDMPVPEPPSRHRGSGLVGRSVALRRALRRAERLARGSLPVLIVGETGTGKELVARHVHRQSSRCEAPWLPVNSGAFSEQLILSDLFGHARGAFTGAERDRPGIFEAAGRGTVFLDEIGDLPLPAQAMLLRVLQEGEVRRLGENKTRHVDARVVAATHRRLERRIADGRFRADLYYRLAVGTVELPPLRDRGDDLELLIRYFLDRVDGGRQLRLSTAAGRRLREHSFPGNVRELENLLAAAAAIAEESVVREHHLSFANGERRPPGGYHQQVFDLRRRLVAEAVEEAGGNRAAAARRLGVSRQALSYLVRSLGLE